MRPAGDAPAHEIALVMRAQRLHQEIMGAQTYEEEEEEEDKDENEDEGLEEEGEEEKEEKEEKKEERPAGVACQRGEKRKREEDTKSKSYINQRRVNTGNELHEETKVYRDYQMNLMFMMTMMLQQQQMMMQLIARISPPPPIYSPYMPDYNSAPFIPTPTDMQVPVAPTSGALPQNLCPLVTSDEGNENSSPDKE